MWKVTGQFCVACGVLQVLLTLGRIQDHDYELAVLSSLFILLPVVLAVRSFKKHRIWG